MQGFWKKNDNLTGYLTIVRNLMDMRILESAHEWLKMHKGILLFRDMTV